MKTSHRRTPYSGIEWDRDAVTLAHIEEDVETERRMEIVYRAALPFALGVAGMGAVFMAGVLAWAEWVGR